MAAYHQVESLVYRVVSVGQGQGDVVIANSFCYASQAAVLEGQAFGEGSLL